jgi:hypothetical protein
VKHVEITKEGITRWFHKLRQNFLYKTIYFGRLCCHQDFHLNGFSRINIFEVLGVDLRGGGWERTRVLYIVLYKKCLSQFVKPPRVCDTHLCYLNIIIGLHYNLDGATW